MWYVHRRHVLTNNVITLIHSTAPVLTIWYLYVKLVHQPSCFRENWVLHACRQEHPDYRIHCFRDYISISRHIHVYTDDSALGTTSIDKYGWMLYKNCLIKWLRQTKMCVCAFQTISNFVTFYKLEVWLLLNSSRVWSFVTWCVWHTNLSTIHSSSNTKRL